MHIPSAYELYILDERERYGWKNDEGNDFPAWLVLESETNYWIVNLGRKMYRPLNDRIVSKRLLKQIEQIPTIRFLRYRDISPSLKQAINLIAQEFSFLKLDLNNPEMWEKTNLLSKVGIKRWRRAVELVSDCEWSVKPDPDWREKVRPYCTRSEAEAIVCEYIMDSKGIDLNEIEKDSNKHKYYCVRMAKDGLFKMRYGIWSKEGSPFHDLGVVQMDMLSLGIKEIQ